MIVILCALVLGFAMLGTFVVIAAAAVLYAFDEAESFEPEDWGDE